MNVAAAVTALDLLLQIIDRSSAAASIIRQARVEGRLPSSAELRAIKDQGAGLLSDLDAEIARAQAEGR